MLKHLRSSVRALVEQSPDRVTARDFPQIVVLVVIWGGLDLPATTSPCSPYTVML